MKSPEDQLLDYKRDNKTFDLIIKALKGMAALKWREGTGYMLMTATDVIIMSSAFLPDISLTWMGSM